MKAKQLAVIFLLLSASAIINGAKSQDQIGDVRYSVLGPDAFRKLHGNTWVLMDGRSIRGSKLAALGMATIPDARGVFIRGMNENRGEDLGDVDGNRRVGSYQPDKIKAHNHGIDNAIGWAGHATHHGLMLERRAPNPDKMISHYNTDSAKETRPRNITLYVYIKIN